jgi:uncharacterized membrane protein
MRQLAIAGVIMLALDAIYLGITRGFWGNVVSSVQDGKMKIRHFSALGAYALLLVGLNYFVLRKGSKPIDGLLYGIVTYGTFELTNHAILDRWPMDAIYLDTLWGGFSMMAVTYCVNKLR